MIGVEGIHVWTSPDALVVELGRTREETGVLLWPHYRLDRIGGLLGLGEDGSRRDKRIGAAGEIPRRGFRGGKTVTYEGRIRARSRAELVEAAADLRAGFADQSDEGRMDLGLHEGHPDYPLSFYYMATSLTVEIDDEFSEPRRITRGWERRFVVALRMADTNFYGSGDTPYA